jgi:drug/metabolite transporter (DMT)-like permease
MASYVSESLLLKKSAAVFLLLLGILLVVVGLHEESSPAIAVGCLSLLGGVLVLVYKIVRRNQGNPL